MKFCSACELAVVVVLLGNERQDGELLPVAKLEFSEHVCHLIGRAPAPREFGPMGGARMGDRTGDGVGMILNGYLLRSHCRFWWISYLRKKKNHS